MSERQILTGIYTKREATSPITTFLPKFSDKTTKYTFSPAEILADMTKRQSDFVQELEELNCGAELRVMCDQAAARGVSGGRARDRLCFWTDHFQADVIRKASEDRLTH